MERKRSVGVSILAWYMIISPLLSILVAIFQIVSPEVNSKLLPVFHLIVLILSITIGVKILNLVELWRQIAIWYHGIIALYVSIGSLLTEGPFNSVQILSILTSPIFALIIICFLMRQTVREQFKKSEKRITSACRRIPLCGTGDPPELEREMNMEIQIKQMSLIKIYMTWVILLTINIVIWLFTGQYYEMMSQAVLKASNQSPNVPHETMISIFIAISIFFAYITMGMGYVFVVYANKNKKWAQWLLLFFCIWQIKSSAFNSIKISRMYPELSWSIMDVIAGILSLILLILLLVKTIFLLRNKNV